MILGDISGSMRIGNRMACLKRSFRTIVRHFSIGVFLLFILRCCVLFGPLSLLRPLFKVHNKLVARQQVALAGWDGWTQWCTNPNYQRKLSEDTRNRAEQADWISEPKDEDWAMAWVKQLRVRGGNNMR